MGKKPGISDFPTRVILSPADDVSALGMHYISLRFSDILLCSILTSGLDTIIATTRQEELT
jgi:hypothetical protein